MYSTWRSASPRDDCHYVAPVVSIWRWSLQRRCSVYRFALQNENIHFHGVLCGAQITYESIRSRGVIDRAQAAQPPPASLDVAVPEVVPFHVQAPFKVAGCAARSPPSAFPQEIVVIALIILRPTPVPVSEGINYGLVIRCFKLTENFTLYSGLFVKYLTKTAGL